MSSAKRPAADQNDPSISPPPVKRKVQSTVTKSAVANFFTPASQKPKDHPRAAWSERAVDDDTPATLLVGRYDTSNKYGAEDPKEERTKIAAFDLDSTLITTNSGKKHSDDPDDWKWWNPSVLGKVRSLYEDGYRIVIISNQAGITLHPDPKNKGPKTSKRLPMWKQKVSAILAQLDIPTCIYAATGKDIFRKPRTGMWKELCEDYGLSEAAVDKEASFFVGDAGGRTFQPAQDGKKAIPKDFSCSDRNFADNVGIKYQTPEEFFLGEPPRDFQRELDPKSYNHLEVGNKEPEVLFEKKNEQEIVLFCGSPGAGKSTFYWTYLKPLGYERVNQDTLKSKDKCLRAAKECLERGGSVAVDNTNPDPETRGQWIALAKKNNVPIRCVWFQTSRDLAEHNNAVRAMNKELNPESRDVVPKLAFNSYSSRFREPQVNEGFEDIVKVAFKFRGTKEHYNIWTKYWV